MAITGSPFICAPDNLGKQIAATDGFGQVEDNTGCATRGDVVVTAIERGPERQLSG
jgi:hypothetical protein